MDAAHGSATAALKPLNRGIREYSLFQGVLLVLDRLRQLNPGLDDEALYERLEFVLVVQVRTVSMTRNGSMSRFKAYVTK